MVVQVERAYALLHVKSVDAERRVLRGTATTPTPDRAGDIIDPLGVAFTNPLPLLLHHDAKLPVGQVFFSPPTTKGIAFEARLPSVQEPGVLRDRVEEAWQSAKYGLLRGVSIGFRVVDGAMKSLKTGGIQFLKTEVVELSLVAIPMNTDATIAVVRSLDAAAAPSGLASRIAPPPGVTGSRQDAAMQPISDQIATEQVALQTKSARLEELMAADEVSAAEAAERDALAEAVEESTKKIAQLHTLEAAQRAQAKGLTTPSGSPAERRAPRVEVPKLDLPKGTLFARYAMAKAAGKGSYSDTLAYAKRWDGQTPEVSAYIKAEVGTSVDASPGWGSELVSTNNLATEFVDLLRPMTIIGRIPGLRMTPFNVPILTQTGGSTFAWVGEKSPKPVGELAFTRDTLGYDKVAGIVVLSEELIRFSRPNAEETVRRDLIEQCAKFLDEQFIQVSVTAGANNPASITNGVTSPAASGTTLSDLQYDLAVALATFDAAGIPTDGLVIVTTPSLARGMSMLTNQLGQTPQGFSVTPNGGTLLGYPVVVSSSVNAGTIVILKPSEIFLADDGRVTLDASNQASLDMAGSTSATFSLWQNNCVGIRAERFITWKKRRAGAVAVIDTAAYGPTLTSP